MSADASSIQHTRTRRDHAMETAEDYVECILEILGHDGKECRLTEVAKRFGVSHVTAKKIIDRLAREGLVETIPYGPLNLTKEGVALAKRAKHRHDLVYTFLVSLGVSAKTAEMDTEGIEHHVSPETLRCMKQYMTTKKN